MYTIFSLGSVIFSDKVLTVADDTMEKTKLAGSLLNQVIASKWKNEEYQKWTVKLFGKYFICSLACIYYFCVCLFLNSGKIYLFKLPNR